MLIWGSRRHCRPREPWPDAGVLVRRCRSGDHTKDIIPDEDCDDARLRFYEREGILAGLVRRGPGGQHLYTDDDVEWLTVCVNLRATGMPIPAIRQYTDLVRRGDGNEQQRLDLLRQHRTRVLAQMDTLQQCLDLISHKVAIYESITASTSPASPCASAGTASNRGAAGRPRQ